MRIESSVVTDVGKKRTINQDNYILIDRYNQSFSPHMESRKTLSLKDNQCYIFGVFDGIGGGTHGEEAARIAAEFFVSPLKSNHIENELRDRLSQANNSIYQHRKGKRDFGTTASVLGLWNGKFRYLHIGDSRIYLFRDKELTQITKDHTLAQIKISAGIYSAQSREAQRESHVLLRSLGGYDATAEIGYEESEWKVSRKGDRYLICSDGLYDMCSYEELISALAVHSDTGECAKKLADQALKNGGADNITVLLVDVL